MSKVEIIKTGWFVNCEAREQAHYIEIRFPSGNVIQVTVDEEAFGRILDELAARGDLAQAAPADQDDLTPDPEPDMGSQDEDGIPPSDG